MHLKLDDLAVPPHPSEIDLNLNLQTAGDAIKAARTIHRQLMEELQEVRKSAVLAARAASPKQALYPEPVLSETLTTESKQPKRVIRRVEIHPH